MNIIEHLAYGTGKKLKNIGKLTESLIVFLQFIFLLHKRNFSIWIIVYENV